MLGLLCFLSMFFVFPRSYVTAGILANHRATTNKARHQDALGRPRAVISGVSVGTDALFPKKVVEELVNMVELNGIAKGRRVMILFAVGYGGEDVLPVGRELRGVGDGDCWEEAI